MFFGCVVMGIGREGGIDEGFNWFLWCILKVKSAYECF